jgi:cytochrome c oxidase subunit III
MAMAVITPVQKTNTLISNEMFGMILFIVTEIMFFTALISAYLVIKSGNNYWVPPDTIRLPIYFTICNTCVLFTSGWALYKSGQYIKSKQRIEGARFLKLSLLMGFLFTLFQGTEWFFLIRDGMTMDSGMFASCFFLLIGSHALHALIGVIFLVRTFLKINTSSFKDESFFALQLFWYFVVVIWPVLFYLVYF